MGGALAQHSFLSPEATKKIALGRTRPLFRGAVYAGKRSDGLHFRDEVSVLVLRCIDDLKQRSMGTTECCGIRDDRDCAGWKRGRDSGRFGDRDK